MEFCAPNYNLVEDLMKSCSSSLPSSYAASTAACEAAAASAAASAMTVGAAAAAKHACPAAGAAAAAWPLQPCEALPVFTTRMPVPEDDLPEVVVEKIAMLEQQLADAKKETARAFRIVRGCNRARNRQTAEWDYIRKESMNIMYLNHLQHEDIVRKNRTIMDLEERVKELEEECSTAREGGTLAIASKYTMQTEMQQLIRGLQEENDVALRALDEANDIINTLQANRMACNDGGEVVDAATQSSPPLSPLSDQDEEQEEDEEETPPATPCLPLINNPALLRAIYHIRRAQDKADEMIPEGEQDQQRQQHGVTRDMAKNLLQRAADAATAAAANSAAAGCMMPDASQLVSNVCTEEVNRMIATLTVTQTLLRFS